MKITTTSIPQLLLLKPTAFEDHRGKNIESYNRDQLKENGIELDFIQDALSYSKKDVLRGFHGDNKTWKLISCPWGEFFVAIVDFNQTSSNYLKWETFNLSSDNHHQLLVPPGFGIAHLAISEKIIFHYKQTTNYDRSSQFTYAWNDPRLSIPWPIDNPILSNRDQPDNIDE